MMKPENVLILPISHQTAKAFVCEVCHENTCIKFPLFVLPWPSSITDGKWKQDGICISNSCNYSFSDVWRQHLKALCHVRIFPLCLRWPFFCNTSLDKLVNLLNGSSLAPAAHLPDVKLSFCFSVINISPVFSPQLSPTAAPLIYNSVVTLI